MTEMLYFFSYDGYSKNFTSKTHNLDCYFENESAASV